MTGSYGRFLEEKGGYRLTEIPEAGSFEYIFKNSRLIRFQCIKLSLYTFFITLYGLIVLC